MVIGGTHLFCDARVVCPKPQLIAGNCLEERDLHGYCALLHLAMARAFLINGCSALGLSKSSAESFFVIKYCLGRGKARVACENLHHF